LRTNANPDRVSVVEENLGRYLAQAEPAAQRLAEHEVLAAAPGAGGAALTAAGALALFEDQLLSRALDVAARALKKSGQGFYTISSAGHEQNAVLGAQLRVDDPCFLHYRSGALMMARARRAGGGDAVLDVLLGLVASADDPIAQGRHKVWGSRRLWVPPQTSTIASQLPKAVGLAVALARARRMRVPLPLPRDAVVCCSFGDASANHAAALSAINAACYSSRGGNPAPILFVCEDNRIGISVETQSGWIEERFGRLPGLAYYSAAGPLEQVWLQCAQALRHCRTARVPVFLHLDCVRLWGHAGSDVESSYRSFEEIGAAEDADPLLANARYLVERGVATPAELSELRSRVTARVAAASQEACRRPRLASREAVIAPLAPFDERAVRRAAAPAVDAQRRRELFGGELPEEATASTRRTLAAHINSALCDELASRPELVLFGEDVGKKGGVYGLTAKLQKRFGRSRVFDTLLDETTILGLAQGAAHIGLLPVPEIQYLAYVHNAIDQLRGEACSLSFFSSGQFTNPMVVRIAGLAYQKGFGGHFHNDNSIGGLRDIPGLMIACPARGDDAVRLLRAALAAARAEGRVVVFLEPIALYHERDLYAEGDQGWLSDYPPPAGGADSLLLPGEVGVYHPEAAELLIASYANGLRLALRAAKRLREEHGVAARVLDLRWLAPLPLEAFAHHARACRAVLVADECRATGGGVAEALVAHLAESGYGGRVASVRAADTYVPLGPAADLVLISEAEIVAAGARLAGSRRPVAR
jgi:2-oxoisovalerate dehydrogenase E1 component